ncbi:hypothetical protein [Singulisphaera sp. PoT]|uniref:hypothetical protein n=1 Tax=Singulisphaera sp. PoT TaxID=3411797 RepID=UPI003BF585F1
MVCSMVKKGLVGATLGASALYLVFGTSTPAYLRTAFHKVRHNAKASVPVQFEIDKTRDEIANLEPVIKDNIETYARNEVEVEHLEREIAATRTNLDNEKKTIVSLGERVRKGDFQLAGQVSYTPEEVSADLAHRLDHYKHVKGILKDRESTLKAKQKSLAAARKQLDSMSAQKKELLIKLEGIEAQLKAIEAVRTTNEFDFDGSALARAKASVSDLESRLEVLSRKAEYEGRYIDSGIPIGTEQGRDVIKEIETEFGGSSKGADTKPTDKSL